MKNVLTALFISCFLSVSHAGEVSRTFGDWFIYHPDDSSDLIAATMNNSDSILGFRCFVESQDCMHILMPNINCDAGSEYPILVNSDHSAVSMDALCGDSGAENELYLPQYDTIHEILEKGNDIGFAIPMESGRFKVVRFSLNGSGKAMRYVEQRTHRTPSSNGKDTYL